MANGLARFLIRPERVRALYRHHFRDRRRQRLFLASCGFFVTFATTRGITHAIRAGRGPLHDITSGTRHLHHLVWGIAALELVGYLWLVRVGAGDGEDAATRWESSVTALLYGAGSALTLDEFALWLNLEDVYWARQGRESIDAIVLFGALLSAGIWGGPFLRALAREWGVGSRQ